MTDKWTMAYLALNLLGPFLVTLDGEPVTDFATDKARALLAYLVVEADRPHRREALTGLLWPDQPEERARQNLRQALSHLRQALGDREDAQSFLRVTRETIAFDSASDHELDVAAFGGLVSTCWTHRHRRLEACQPCFQRLHQAIALYRGDFLQQFFLSDSEAFEEWALLKREWLRRQAVEALTVLANYYECRGDYAQARLHAWKQVELEPWREEAHRQLMRLLALEGQRSAALAQYETCHRVLAEELAIEPTAETIALYERIRAGPDLRPRPPLHNLPPPPTSFVGRKAEQSELAELLANPDCRLVTLLGPGGIGKTRLALQVAADQVGAFAHGVYFVPLAPLDSAELIVPAIAEALQLLFQSHQDLPEQLLSYLSDKEMLLVLDSMEHVLAGSDLLAEVLKRAPGAMLLVTSRERLNLREEWVYEVSGLAYPVGESLEDTRDPAYSAVELFQQRAGQVNRRFSLAQEGPAVVRICQLVEGMPLGVELAAAWVGVRACEEIARELERNLSILTTSLRNVPPRHRSIWAAFEHSWQLLSDAERGLFVRLSTFRGGFRLEAAAEVAGAALAPLAALLDKSLLRQASVGRYDMHELLRQYAAEKLAALPQEQESTGLRHARYFASLLEMQEERFKGAGQKEALQTIAPEIENARQAWQRAVVHGWAAEVEKSLESLHHFFNIQSRFQEGIDLFAQAIERWRGDRQQAGLVGKALARQGALYYRRGRYAQARAALEEGVAIFERLGIPSEQIFALVRLATVARAQGKYEETESLARQGLVLSQQIGDHWGTASALFLLADLRRRAGEVDQAAALLEEGLEFGRKSGNRRLLPSLLNALGDIACHRGDYDRARALFDECLALSRELRDPFNTALYLNNLGTVLHQLNDYAGARSLYRESLEICRRIGDPGGQAIALSNLGEVALALGEARQAQELYQEGLVIARDTQDHWTTVTCLNNLGEIAGALKDARAARAYLAEALRIAQESQTLTLVTKVLVNLAVLWTREGRPGRAAALLDLVIRHPASEQDIQSKAERLRAEIGPVLPEPIPSSLDLVISEILDEISA